MDLDLNMTSRSQFDFRKHIRPCQEWIVLQDVCWNTIHWKEATPRPDTSKECEGCAVALYSYLAVHHQNKNVYHAERPCHSAYRLYMWKRAHMLPLTLPACDRGRRISRWELAMTESGRRKKKPSTERFLRESKVILVRRHSKELFFCGGCIFKSGFHLKNNKAGQQQLYLEKQLIFVRCN